MMLLTTVSKAKLTAELYFFVKCERNYREYKIARCKVASCVLRYSSLHTFYHKYLGITNFLNLSHKNNHHHSHKNE